MDDTTLSEISRKSSGSNLQVSADQVSQWSKDNELGINCTKTKDMVVAFERPPNDFKAQLPPEVWFECEKRVISAGVNGRCVHNRHVVIGEKITTCF